MIPRILPSFPPFFNRRSCVVDVSTNVPSTSDVSSSSSQSTYGLGPPLLPLVHYLGFPSADPAVLESTSYREAVVHSEW